MNKPEAVLRFSFEMISHLWGATYQDLLNIFHIEKLQERRLTLKLTQVYKIAHGLCYLADNVYVLHESCSAKLAMLGTMSCPFACTNYYFHSFAPSVVRA